MLDNPKEPNLPKRLKAWLEKARFKTRSGNAGENTSSKLSQLGQALRHRIPSKWRDFDFDLNKIELADVTSYTVWLHWILLILGIFLLAAIVSGIIGLFLRPSFPAIQKKPRGQAQRSLPTEDYDAILRRNMFNVEGKIPDPFDQGLLDCMSQARLSQQKIQLLGTIVMGDEKLSVALIQDEGTSAAKIGVKKDDSFGDGKFIAMKVDRKRLCFQVRATQEFEYVEIPEENLGIQGGGPAVVGGISTEGITPVSETEYAVKKDFLDKNLLNLNEILQTARAEPYVEPGSGKFKGFLVKSIDDGSPFASLGIRRGDILTGVNDIVLDNAGKGLEAFQRLRNSPRINLEVIRGGQKTSLNYDVK